MIKYLSPSSTLKYIKDPIQFYAEYMLGVKREPQTAAMALGSAFDARIKGHLLTLFPDAIGIPFEEQFASSVEEQNKEEVYGKSLDILNRYLALGTLSDCMFDHGKLVMESKLEKEVLGVPLCGKPDLLFNGGVLDWKVSGFYSKNGATPEAGYTKIRGEWSSGRENPIARSSMKAINLDWYVQLTMYGWLMGVPVGERVLGRIEKICAHAKGIRVAVYEHWLDDTIQLEETIKKLWDMVQNDSFPEYVKVAARQVAGTDFTR